jgi:hypothetical protein
MWADDYVDIRDHIRRVGALDVSGEPSEPAEFYDDVPTPRIPVWAPPSAEYLRRRHEDYKLKLKEREERRVRFLAEHEEAVRKRRERLQAVVDRERAERDAARAWWGERNPYYADKEYIPTLIRWACVIDGDVELPADRWIWLPQPVVAKLPQPVIGAP